MAYDSKTYGQSPFGKPTKPATPAPSPPTSPSSSKGPIDDGLDKGPDPVLGKGSGQSSTGLTSKFPTISTPGITSTPKADSAATKTTSSKRSKSTAKGSRKSKKAKAAEIAQAEADAAEAAVARRFAEEDKRTYFSLLQNTVISGLVWAVLRLSRHELSEQALVVVNVIIHPLVISAIAIIAVVCLAFWLRRLLNDLARHTQQLQADAETEDTKNYRPTVEILGDSLEYNAKLRKNFARFFNAASLLICTLTSYLLVIGLTLAWQVR